MAGIKANLMRGALDEDWNISDVQLVGTLDIGTTRNNTFTFYNDESGGVMVTAASTMRKFEMTTPGDLSTFQFTDSFSYNQYTGSATVFIEGGWWSADGLRIAASEDVSNRGTILTYATPYLYQNPTVISQVSDLPNQRNRGCQMSEDGINYYIITESGDVIRHFILSTPWDLSTKTLANNLVVGQGSSFMASPQDLYLRPNGSMIWVFGNNGGTSILRAEGYKLSTPFDLSTAVFHHEKSFFTDNQNRNFAIANNGKSVYLHSQGNGLLYQFKKT